MALAMVECGYDCGGYGRYGNCGPRDEDCMFTAAPVSEGLVEGAPKKGYRPRRGSGSDDDCHDYINDSNKWRPQKEKYFRPITGSERDPFHDQYNNDEKLRRLFRKTTHGDNDMGWRELKEALENVLRKEFSKDVCRSLIAMMDVDNSGKLEFDEFKTLIENIKMFSEMFKKFDVKGRGYLDQSQLVAAFGSAGYKLKNKVVKLLRFRYATRDGLIAFDDFLMCAIRLKTMEDAYKAKACEDDNNACFTLEDWMKINLRS